MKGEGSRRISCAVYWGAKRHGGGAAVVADGGGAVVAWWVRRVAAMRMDLSGDILMDVLGDRNVLLARCRCQPEWDL